MRTVSAVDRRGLFVGLNIAAPAPNFISEIFFLSIAMSHYGLLKTVDSYNEMHKHISEYQRQLDQIQGDGSWMGVRALYLVLSFDANGPFRHRTKHGHFRRSTRGRCVSRRLFKKIG